MSNLFEMRIVYIGGFLMLVLNLFPLGVRGQIYDCELAQVICSDSTIYFDPRGGGIMDFDNPNNDQGCLEEGERITAWYYFEFREDMPTDDYEIEFTIRALGGGNTDYDFAIYGPDLQCDSLGSPLRCSFADPNNLNTASDSTGLRPYVYRKNALGAITEIIEQTETSEGRLEDPYGRAADGFVAPMIVYPKQGFYLVLDFFQRDYVDTLDFLQFELTWGGRAAPYLNCIANPRCIDAYAEAGSPQEVCAGDQTLQLSGTAFNTNGGESFTWKGSGETTTFLDNPNSASPSVNIPNGFSGEIWYTLQYKEGKCVKEDSVRLDVKPGPSPSITGDTLICPDGGGTIAVAGGYASYEWSDGYTSKSRPVTAAGDYRVSVTDSDNCPGVGDFSVGNYSVQVPTISGERGFCPGGETTLTASSGFVEYRWSTGVNTPDLVVDTPGDYKLTVTTAEGCEVVDSLTVIEYPAPSPSISGSTYLCEGASLTLGTGAYQNYQWSTGSEEPFIVVDAPGDFSLTVTDDRGCVGDATKTITQRANPVPVINGEDTICSGDTTILDAGLGYQQYQWSSGDTTRRLRAFRADTYAVTVTDAFGCSGATSRNLDTLAAPRPVVSGGNTFCRGDSIFLDAGAGYASYRWSTGASQQSIKVKTAGNYSVSVTNDLGCLGTEQVSIKAFDKRPPEIDSRYTLCSGDSVRLDAGPGFLDYRWSTGDTSRDLTVTSGAGFQVTVTDENGCISSREALVEEFSIVEPVVRGQEDFCSGQSVSLFVDGPYVSYLWSNEDSTSNISITKGGFYEVTVTDGNGCTAVKGKSVLEKQSPIVDIEGDTIFCQGDSTVLAVASGYATYTWTNGSNTPVITVKDPGPYGVVVRAENGCTTNDQVMVKALEAPNPSIGGELDYCPNTTTMLDAGPGYTSYKWSDSTTAQTLVVRTPGIYSVTVTNEAQCPGSAQTIVRQFPGPRPEIETKQYFCSGSVAMLTADSNFVAYRWSTGDSTYQIDVAGPGDYQVTVIDGNGCEAEKNIFLEELAVPAFEVTGDRHFCEGSTTTLGVEELFARYQWSTGSNRRSIEVDSVGNYAVTVTNAVGCTTEKAVDIIRVGNPFADAGAPQQLDCRQPLARIGGPGSTTGDRLAYQWSGPGINEFNQGKIMPAVSVGGSYHLQVVDTVYGCRSLMDTVTVEDFRFSPKAVARVTDTLTCVSQIVRIDATGSETGEGIVYNWSDALGTAIPASDPLAIEVQEPGLYRFSVLDTLTGCRGEAQAVVVANRSIPIADAGPPRQLDCLNEEVQLDARGTKLENNLEYFWLDENGGELSIPKSLTPTLRQPGKYFLKVVDRSSGCESLDSVVVIRDVEEPFAEAGADKRLDCDLPSLFLEASASSGEGFRYEWTARGNPGFQSSQLRPEVDSAGTYFLLVTDEGNGCAAIDSVVVTRNTNIPTGLSLLTRPTTCFGDSDGRIEVAQVIGGQEPFLFRLNNQPYYHEQAFSDLDAGTYEITVQDLNGCEITTTAEVPSGNDLALDVGEDRSILLGETVTLQAIANIPPEEIKYFRWTVPDTLPNDTSMVIDVQPFDQTQYKAIVVDSNGCQATDNLLIVVRRESRLYVPNAFSPNNDGHNDRFILYAPNDAIRIRNLKIFSRWGKLVYEKDNPMPNNPADGWDGRYQGKFMNPQVFAYTIEIEYPDGSSELLKGDVTLMR